jgi:hypothetical protein
LVFAETENSVVGDVPQVSVETEVQDKTVATLDDVNIEAEELKKKAQVAQVSLPKEAETVQLADAAVENGENKSVTTVQGEDKAEVKTQLAQSEQVSQDKVADTEEMQLADVDPELLDAAKKLLKDESAQVADAKEWDLNFDDLDFEEEEL